MSTINPVPPIHPINEFDGTSGDDTVHGLPDFFDRFLGFGVGADTVVGGAAGNYFQLSADSHTDHIFGGAGEDLIDYRQSNVALTVNLATNLVSAVINSHVATVATLSSIEDVIGSSFNDHITGNGADNLIEGAVGADVIDGAGGINTASYAHSAAPVAIDLRTAGAAQHGGDAEGDKLFHIQNIIGSAGADNIMGSFDGDNVIEGGAGADILSAAEFDSTAFHFDPNTVSYLNSSAGVNVNISQVLQHGGDAEGDQLAMLGGVPSFDNVWGSQFADTLTGNRFNNDLRGEGGADTFIHTLGGDTIDGGAGSDTYVVGQLTGAQNNGNGVDIFLFHGAGQATFADGSSDVLTNIESLVGSQNNDELAIFSGDTVGGTIHGGAGADQIQGGAGNDFLFGDAGSDLIEGGVGADHIDGGVETNPLFTNTAAYGNSASGVRVILQNFDSSGTPIAGPGHGFFGDAQGDTLVNIQNLFGSSHDDLLVGDAAKNVLIANGGNDTLIGGLGHDTLIGGPGNDILTGGNGDGFNWGGSPLRDPDTFEFTVGSNSTVNTVGAQSSGFTIGNDIITDFTPGVDTLLLSGLGANQGVHVVQHGADAFMTIQDVTGSITLQNTLAANVHFTTV